MLQRKQCICSVSIHDVFGRSPIAERQGHIGITQCGRNQYEYSIMQDPSEGLMEVIWRYGHSDEERLSEIVKLLENGADPNFVGPLGSTPLIYAASKGYARIVRELIRYGAKVHEANDQGITAIMVAKNVDVVDELLRYGASVILRDLGGNTALMRAVDRGDLAIVYELLRWEPDPENATEQNMINMQNDLGQTALMRAVSVKETTQDMREKLLAISEVLLRNGANPDIQDKGGHTALALAVMEEDKPDVQLLLRNGADPNIRGTMGVTPLMHAVGQNNLDLVTLLLSHSDTLVNDKDIQGNTPLMIASVHNKDGRIMEALLDAGADVNAQDRYGRFSLLHAVEKGNQAAFSLLISHPLTNLNLVNQYGMTALMEAVSQGNEYMVDQLLARGADINAQDQKGYTPLMIATIKVKPGLVKKLLDAGADKRLRNEDGKTAEDLSNPLMKSLFRSSKRKKR